MDVFAQVNAVREKYGLIDRSQTGKIAVTGEDRFTWLQGMISNDIKLLANSRNYGFFQACILDATGHILTDMSIVRVEASSQGKRLADALDLGVEAFVLLDLPRENVSPIMTLLDRYIILEDVELKDISDALGCFSLQGRYALDIGEHAQGVWDDTSRAVWNQLYTMPADYTGEMGFNIYFPATETAHIRSEIAHVGVIEAGPEAQEILRVEAGIPKYGMDMDATTLAPEAGLMPTHISLTKGCYMGQEVIARIDSRGHTNRALTGLVFHKETDSKESKSKMPAPGDKILATADDGATKETGRITGLVAASPAMNMRPIALGYVRHEHRIPGNRLKVRISDTEVSGTEAVSEWEAEVVELPFYHRRGNHRRGD